MTWRYQTRALTCSAPWPQMAVSPGAGGSSMASWRTGPNPAFLHWLHSARSSLPSWCSMLSPRPGSARTQGSPRWDQGQSGGQQNASQNFLPVSCLTHQENTLCPHKEEKDGRKLFPWRTERVFSALIQTSWPDPSGSETTCWQSGESSFRPGSGRGARAPQSPGKCEGVECLRTHTQVQFRTRQHVCPPLG